MIQTRDVTGKPIIIQVGHKGFYLGTVARESPNEHFDDHLAPIQTKAYVDRVYHCASTACGIDYGELGPVERMCPRQTMAANQHE